MYSNPLFLFITIIRFCILSVFHITVVSFCRNTTNTGIVQVQFNKYKNADSNLEWSCIFFQSCAIYVKQFIILIEGCLWLLNNIADCRIHIECTNTSSFYTSSHEIRESAKCFIINVISTSLSCKHRAKFNLQKAPNFDLCNVHSLCSDERQVLSSRLCHSWPS